MESITLLIVAAGCVLVLCVRPIYGLMVYASIAIAYPYCVGRVSLGRLDFSAGRILIIVLLIKVLSDKKITRNFRWIWLDRLILILFGAEIVAGLFNVEPMKLIEYRGGDFFDMALPYFAVRLLMTSKNRYILFLKTVSIVTAGLAIFAFYESLTGHNLLAFGRTLTPGIRLERFYRATSTFRHPNYWGPFCAMVGVLSAGLFGNIKKNKPFYLIVVVLVFLGAFSSMSSGALVTMIGGFGFIAFYRYRHYWKTAVVGIVIMCCLVEVISNRHFYDVIDRVAFQSSTAWYRVKLIEVAFFEGGMSDHWITGYGYKDPGWGPMLDWRNKTDLANHYILKLVRYGLIGFIPFLAMLFMVVRLVFKDIFRLRIDSDTWLVWCLAGGLMAVLLAFNSVSLFGQPMVLLFMMFGFCVMVPRVLLTEEYEVLQDQSKRFRDIPREGLYDYRSMVTNKP